MEVVVDQKVSKSVEMKIHEDIIRPHPDSASSGIPKTPAVSEATPSPKSSVSGIFD